MTDVRADEENRLPWLEAVDEEDDRDGPSPLKLIVAVLIGLAAIGGIVGGWFWLQNRDGGGAGGEPELIRAPEGDYKTRPDDPGGMAVEGEGDTAFAISAGENKAGRIDTGAVPEAPVTQTPQPKAEPAQPKASPAQPKASPPAAAGETIQLGAFPSQAAAEKAWKALSGRFGYLAPLSHTVVAAQVGGKTWYRLRASGAGAGGICGKLRVAGENCFEVD